MDSGCASEHLQDMTGAQSESMQALATARQLIVDGAENLQVGQLHMQEQVHLNRA